MPGIYFARISNDKSGFTNQIFALVNSIMNAIQRGNNIIVLDSFQRDYIDCNNKIPCKNIFNLDETNKYLKKYDITLICKTDFNYNLNAVLYGVGENIIDLTDYVSTIIFPGGYNEIGGDPFTGVIKELFINYTINDIEYSDIYHEYYPYNIWVKGIPDYEYTFKWFNKESKPIFDEIMKNIKYNQTIDNYSFIPVYSNTKINVIHLRLENDAIKHWSNQNNVEENDFKTYLENNYIKLVKEYIDPTFKTIIVGDKNNKVVDFLKNNNYDYIYYDLNFNGREINAIYDLIQSSQCNQTFISNFNYDNLNGSTFSYYISLLSNPKTIISIDMDNIFSYPKIIQNKYYRL